VPDGAAWRAWRVAALVALRLVREVVRPVASRAAAAVSGIRPAPGEGMTRGSAMNPVLSPRGLA
jgi:hypothetical protein